MEDIWDKVYMVLLYAMIISQPVGFVVFLILAIRQYRKIAREKIGKAKAITFSILSGCCLTGTIEYAIVIGFLAAVVINM